MIKIARFIVYFSGEAGGPANHIIELTKSLKDYPIKTTIYATSDINYSGNKKAMLYEKLGKNFIIKRYNSYLKFKDYRITLKLFQSVLKDSNNLDLFHSHSFRSFQEDIASFISFLKKKPLIITPHGSISINFDYSDIISKKIYDKMIGYIKKKIHNLHFIAVAKNEISIMKDFGIDESNIHYIPHGINTEIFKPVNSVNLKKKYDLINSDVILYVGRIAKGKGVDILIKILNLVVKKNDKVKLIIVGNDAGYLHVVKSLIKKYNLFNKVILTGFVSKFNLPQYYSMADIVIYPSRQEIFGHVVTEAAACGKVVIGSDIMGPSEIIKQGKTGFKTNFQDIEKVSNLILEILDDKERLKKMGRNAIKRVKKKYSWKRAANSHFKLYRQVLNLD